MRDLLVPPDVAPRGAGELTPLSRRQARLVFALRRRSPRREGSTPDARSSRPSAGRGDGEDAVGSTPVPAEPPPDWRLGGLISGLAISQIKALIGSRDHGMTDSPRGQPLGPAADV